MSHRTYHNILTEEILELSKSLAAEMSLFAAWRAIVRSERNEWSEEEPISPFSWIFLESLISSSKWARSEILRAKSAQSFLKNPEKPALDIRTMSRIKRSGTVVAPPSAAVVSPPAILRGKSARGVFCMWFSYNHNALNIVVMGTTKCRAYEVWGCTVGKFFKNNPKTSFSILNTILFFISTIIYTISLIGYI